MNPDATTFERLFPQKPTLTREELIASLDSIQSQIQALIEPAYWLDWWALKGEAN